MMKDIGDTKWEETGLFFNILNGLWIRKMICGSV